MTGAPTSAALVQAVTIGATSAADQAAAILGALPAAVLLVGPGDTVRYANPAAEQLFGVSAATLAEAGLGPVLAPHSPLLELVGRVRRQDHGVTEHHVSLDLPRRGMVCLVDIQATPQSASAGHGPAAEREVVVAIQERTIASRLGRQFAQRDAGRSLGAMAATLAHEVKNPLSGIRGAAQLLGQNAPPSDAELARLICDEVDRIRGLIDRMEALGDSTPLPRTPLNVHELLDHVCALARNGFARQVRIVARYDPSLPLIEGNRDELVQAFLNLVKNAAEAVPSSGGEIILSTAYEYGLSLRDGGGRRRTQLPISLSVQDNGDGIPDDVRPHLFEPFFTTKANGRGLGLALVARIVADHGGVLEFDSRPRRTVFTVLLPSHRGDGA
jgi:two-component system nitrogen regulation sensor histidine kinase GlnL